MTRLLSWLSIVALLLLVPSAHADSLDQLVGRADMIFRSKTSAALLEMEVKTSSHQRSFKIVAWDDTDGDKSLIKILGPASWRGNATLKIGNKLKIYNPKTNHVQVIGHSMLGNSWMGSHFSNDDLVKETRLARDYTLKLLDKRTGPASVGGTATYYRIAMTPRPTAPIAWGRIVYELFDNSIATIPLKAEYFRKPNDSLASRTITFSDITELAGRQVPTTLRVTLASKPAEYTRITYQKLRLDVKLPTHKFTEQAMKH